MKRIRFLLLGIVAFLAFAPVAEAKIDLLPRKVVIDRQNRIGELTILNLGDKPTTFRIQPMHYIQNNEGVYRELEQPLNPAFDPEQVLRLSPRQFTLPVGGRQKVRFSIRPPADLPAGEYRFHLKAMELAKPSGETKPEEPAEGKSVNLSINLGVSIPVIYRHGDIDGTAKLTNITLVSADRTESKRPELHLRVERTGKASTIGALAVMWEPHGGEPRKIASIGNLNVFEEIAYRDLKLPLMEMPTSAGVLRLRYVDDGGMEQGRVFDEVVVQR